MQILLLVINGLLMIVTPLAVGTYLARRYRTGWGLFGAGAVTFVASQILHIPFNALVEATILPEVGPGFSTTLVLVALFYGFSAGVFEEVGGYLTFRFWRKDARSWAEGLMVGAGHGGVEALIVGLLFVVNMAVLIGISRGFFRGMIPAELLPDVEAQVQALFASPWYELLLGGVERIFAILLHLGLSLIVLHAVRRRAIVWLLVAITWHALFNAVALVLSTLTSVLVVEGVLGLFALLSLALIWFWRDRWQAGDAPEDLAVQERPAAALEREELEEKDLDLDESRYLD